MTAIKRWVTGSPFPYRANSLNLFRLILAAMVLVAHSFYIVGRGIGPQLHGENLGGWAVAGFFVLSGFLITRSRLRTAAGTYLLHRVARIYPAFLVCIVLTALVFAPLSLVWGTADVRGFLTTAPTPLEYIWGNLGLKITQYDIGATLDNVPYPNAWNGSLWTLYFEFLCYLTIWVLGAWAVFRRSILPVASLFVVSVVVQANIGVVGYLGLNEDFILLSKLLPFFLGGAVAYYVIDRLGISRLLGVAALVAATLSIVLIPGWGGQASAPFLAYGLLFLSTVVPQPTWIARNDISYGFYIYAWPVQQIFVLLGGAAWDFSLYIVTTAVITGALATASWFFVERPCMSRVRGRPEPSSPVRAPSN